jgi:serine/threonine-protein kinase
MGEVFLAEDTKLKRMVALKRLPPDRCSDPLSRQRLVKEAERASQLSDPNIAAVYDVFEQDGVIYLVLEYVEGRSLRERMREPVSLGELAEIAEQVCQAIASAHMKRIVHCDIKPENILFTPDGRLKLLDFGVARKMPPEVFYTHQPTLTIDQFMGFTPDYASPELLQQQKPDARSDIFSLGVVLFELASRRHPFRSATPQETAYRILHVPPPSLAKLNQEIPTELDRIIQRCLAKTPADRYQDGQTLLAALRALRPQPLQWRAHTG